MVWVVFLKILDFFLLSGLSQAGAGEPGAGWLAGLLCALSSILLYLYAQRVPSLLSPLMFHAVHLVQFC